MRDIVIHGASSFIGRHFCKLLAATKHRVCVISRQQSKLEFLNEFPQFRILKYQNSINEIDPDKAGMTNPVFFEFSWHGVFGSDRNDPRQLTINIPLMINSVSFAAALATKHWIAFGSQAEYGNLDMVISESEECKPTTLYGKSKLLCSQITSELCQNYGIEHSWLRLFSVYGPNDNHEWLIQYLIRKMLLNEEIQVTKGEQKWDYLYIDDITRLLMLLVDCKGTGIANLGSGKSVTVKSIIEQIRVLTQTKSNIQYGALPYRPDQVMLMQADISHLVNHTGWKPEISMNDGLASTVAFIKNSLQTHS